MNRSITIRTGLRLRHLDELEDLDFRTQHLPLGLGAQVETAFEPSRAKVPVFAYVFNWKTPVLGGVLQSPHTLEVAIAFGTTGAASALVGTGLDIRKLVSETMTCWASFAHSGVPAARGG